MKGMPAAFAKHQAKEMKGASPKAKKMEKAESKMVKKAMKGAQRGR
jgi:hypothetical protein